MTAPTLPRPGASLLSDADRDLIRMLADGMSAAAIGRRTFVSERVVQRRVQTIVDRTGTRNAMHLVATALRSGWLDTALAWSAATAMTLQSDPGRREPSAPRTGPHAVPGTRPRQDGGAR